MNEQMSVVAIEGHDSLPKPDYLAPFYALPIYNPAKPAALLAPAGQGMLAVIALTTRS